MAKALTARSVEAVRPKDDRQEIPDGALPGLYLVVQSSGAKSWAVRYRFGGKPRKHTLGPYPLLSLADARKAAREALQAVALGLDPAKEKSDAKAAAKMAPKEPDDRDLVRGVVREFIDRHASKNRSGGETRRILEREVLPRWGERRLDAISRRDVIDLLDEIVDRGAPIMANRTLAAVRKLFNWAVSRDVLSLSPCAGVKPPGAERSRDRVLSDDELRWFWRGTADLGWPFGPLYRVLLLTAQRCGEVAEMRERELEGVLWTIPQERAKNGKSHAVPLSAEVLDVLTARPRLPSATGFVFTTNGDRPSSGFSKAKSRLDARMLQLARAEAVERGESPEEVSIPHWTPHDLRRTAASGMARLGVQMPVIERVLNHVSGSFAGVAGVYNRHSYAEGMRQALDAWGRFVMEIAGGRPVGVTPPRLEAAE